MSFLDWFRPKWQNSNPEIRVHAVRALDDDQMKVLLKVAQSDGDPRVRKVALRRIDDLEVLGSIARDDEDDEIRKLAGDKFTRILVGAATSGGDGQAREALAKLTNPKAVVEVARAAADETVRRAALAKLKGDDDSLLDVARNAKDVATRKAAVAAIGDAAMLEKLAMSEPNKDLALAALARIGDRTVLEAIAHGTKSKAVRRAARERLSETAADQPGGATTTTTASSPEMLRHARRLQLCLAAEALGNRSDLASLPAEVATLRASWAEIGATDEEDAKLAQRFAKAAERALERHSALEAARATQARKVAAESVEKAAKAERAGKAEKKELQVKQEPLARHDRAESGDKTESREAPAISVAAAPSGPSEEELRRAAEKAESRRLADEETRRSEQENLARLEEVCTRLEAVGTDQRREVEEELKVAQSAFASAGPVPRAEMTRIKDRFQAARKRLLMRVQDLREAEDWQRWANVAKLERLCLRAEDLRARVECGEYGDENVAKAPAAEGEPAPGAEPPAVDVETTSAPIEEVAAASPPSEIAPTEPSETATTTPSATPAPRPVKLTREILAELKQLQAEWKQVGAAPRDRSTGLWQRFKGACDGIYQNAHAQLKAGDGEQTENLTKKLALCEKVDAVIAGLGLSTDDTIDWKGTADLIKQLQAEWKTTGPVPRQQGDAAWKRFREACDRFFERRQAHFGHLDDERSGNLKRKRELCEEAEAVASSPDWQEAAKVIKQLQADWKTIGPVPKADSDSIWRRFRGACDQVFAKRAAAQGVPAPEAADDDAEMEDAALAQQRGNEQQEEQERAQGRPADAATPAVDEKPAGS